MTGAEHLPAARCAPRPARRAGRRPVLRGPRPAAAPGRGADLTRAARRRARRPRRASRATARTSSCARCGTATGAGACSASPDRQTPQVGQAGGGARHRLRAARPARRVDLRVAVGPGELRRRHRRPPTAARPAVARARGGPARRATPSTPRDPASAATRPDHHAVRRQPAEGRHRALARPASPRILLLNDPTRGVDLGAKRDIYALLDELAAEGVAVVMLSTEVDEHVELMDRVLVFREGALAARSSTRPS